jgi:hypothetical protein
VPGMFIANLLDDRSAAMPVVPIGAPPPGPNVPPPPAHNGPAYWIKVTAQSDGAFTVTNTRNGFAQNLCAECRIELTRLCRSATGGIPSLATASDGLAADQS